MISTTQGMVDGSARKPALRQDTGYMVEKIYLDIAPYLGAAEFYFRDLPPLCSNYELSNTFDMDLGVHKCEL